MTAAGIDATVTVHALGIQAELPLEVQLRHASSGVTSGSGQRPDNGTQLSRTQSAAERLAKQRSAEEKARAAEVRHTRHATNSDKLEGLQTIM